MRHVILPCLLLATAIELKERLLEPADIRIIGSSSQFSHQHNGYESWTNLPGEVYRMVDLIKETPRSPFKSKTCKGSPRSRRSSDAVP